MLELELELVLLLMMGLELRGVVKAAAAKFIVSVLPMVSCAQVTGSCLCSEQRKVPV